MIARLSRLLATTRGTMVALGIMTLFAAFAAYEVHVVRQKLAIQGNHSEAPELRTGIAVLTLIDRLHYRLQEIAWTEDGRAVPKHVITDFAGALRNLERYADRLSEVFESSGTVAASGRAEENLAATIAAAKAAIEADFADPVTLEVTFSGHRERTKYTIIRYFHLLAEEREAAFLKQERTLAFFTASIYAAVLAMLGAFSALVLVLRREVGIRIGREKAERHAEYLSRTDPLTGLPNRSQLHHFLGDRITRFEDFQLLLIDVSRFGEINERYGHATGDAVLRALSERLRALAGRSGGEAVHLGADEFALVLPLFAQEDGSQICSSIEEMSIRDGTNRVFVKTAIGRAGSDTLRAEGHLSTDGMIRAVELALSEAKYRSHEQFVTYTPELEQRHARRRELLDSIPRAIEDDEFFVAFQPKVDLADGYVYGFEALIRWRHQGRVISPADFLPLAEETRLIVDLDLLVLGDAVRQVASWNRVTGRDYAISVNLSALHFSNRDIVTAVADLLADLDFNPSLLTLEITETVMLDDWEGVQAILADLSALGVKISLDDFGTGYSSLAYLRRISADELKIDRSFVTEIEQSSEAQFVLDAIVDIATGLGMKIVVEGIETEEQARIVSGFGCDRGQGYLWGAPKPAGETEVAILEAVA
ncbi:putative bifunctional diguanylate cyclase/phosphodiesterase [Aestuariibius sp. 2305UL40-4]|uniref:putative bifunctional diguanylate cyclase/phosphodiesterase n=1 Tax=Aestuariibius violaceus TaxID=3234132 RepID=UPI00345F075B